MTWNKKYIRNLCLATLILTPLITNTAGAQQVSVPNGRPNLTVPANEDKEVAALKAELEALKKRVAETEKRLAGVSLLLAGLDKGVGAFRKDFENHYHPLNINAHVGSDDLYVVVDGKNHFVKNPHGATTLLTKAWSGPDTKEYDRSNFTDKPVLGE